MSQSYDTQGTIHSIGETTEYGDNGFTKREFVILLTGETENPKFPNYIKFEILKDKCALLDEYQAGNEIKVGFNLTGRIWAGNGEGEKCFCGFQAWQLELLNIGAQAHHRAPSDITGVSEPGSLAPGTGAPGTPDYIALAKEYWASDRDAQNSIWALASEPLQAAINAANPG